MMILKEFPQRNFGKSKVGIALHEAVHLFSHPPGRSNRIRATVYEMLGRGLLEGLTQMVTEDILSTQCIGPMRGDWQAYKNLTPIARKFMQALSPRIVADAYFLGGQPTARPDPDQMDLRFFREVARAGQSRGNAGRAAVD